MTLTITQKNLLNKMRVILLASCHAPDCNRISKCPNQCSCRTRRTFALNTETAICWEIADEIWDISRRERPLKQDLSHLVSATKAYSELARYHMTRGWQNFFLNLHRCIDGIINPYLPIDHARFKRTIKYLENCLKRVKRFPKEIVNNS